MERFINFSNRVYRREGVLKQTRTGVMAVHGESPVQVCFSTPHA